MPASMDQTYRSRRPRSGGAPRRAARNAPPDAGVGTGIGVPLLRVIRRASLQHPCRPLSVGLAEHVVRAPRMRGSPILRRCSMNTTGMRLAALAVAVLLTGTSAVVPP